MTKEEILDLAEDIEFTHYVTGPSPKDPDHGLRVTVKDGNVTLEEWDLVVYLGELQWFKQTADLRIEELLSPHRVIVYSGDQGWTLEDVVRMPPREQKPAIIAAGISHLAYYGGDEDRPVVVEEVGD